MSSQDTSVRQRKPGKQAAKETSDQKQSEPSKQVGQYASPSIGAKLFLGFLVFVFVAGYGVFLFPDAAVDIVSSWLGVDQSRSGWLPGSSPNTYVGFEADVPKRDAVVAAFKHAWGAYEKDAMGADEYHPLSHNGSYLVAAGGIGYTVVDSLDTMLLMGLDDEYQRARKWVEDTVDFDRDGNFNTFETTIRVLGGLLSAYHLSGGDKLYLEKAVDLADRILPAFVGAGLPLSNVNLAKRKGVPNVDDQGLVSTAEAATLQLEFRYLSVLTDDDVYWRTAEKVMALIRANKMDPALVPIFMNPEDGRFVTGPVRLGSRGDSYYEYLLKQYLQTNATEDVYRDMYGDAVSAIHNHLVQRSPSSGLLYTAELIPERTRDNQIAWRLTPKQDFLVCFFAGTLMLGATRAHSVSTNVTIPPLKEQLTADGVRDWALGVELLETCLATHQTQTGLAPEIAHFRIPSDNMEKMGSVPRDWYIKGARPGAPAPYDARYMLRPETVESLLYAFRLTGDQRWRDAGWNIFQAIEKHCKIPSGGYATIFNVDALPVEHEDKMETFFMSETLKYLYLLFSDDKVVPLSEYVFNTEAHPLPIFKPTIRTGFI